MNTIYVNFKDVQFLIGCTTYEAKCAVFNALEEPIKREYKSGGGKCSMYCRYLQNKPQNKLFL